MKRFFAISALVFALCCPTFVSAQILPIITRDAEYNQIGMGVLTPTMATTWGGVVMQATVTFRDAAAHEIDPAQLSLSFKSMQGRDGFCLNYQTKCYWISLDRNSLIAIARWIESKGTGAFSAFRLSPEVLHKAGLTRAGLGRVVPIEFRSTPLVETLEAIDFTSLLDDSADTNAILKTRQAVSSGMTTVDAGSYFNADLDSNFSARLSGSEIRWSGVPLRYTWSKTSGEYVRVTRVDRFLEPTAVPSFLRRQASEEITSLQKKIAASNIEGLKTFYKEQLTETKAYVNSEEFKKDIAEAASEAGASLDLYRTVATLRTVKLKNGKVWSAFLEAISSEFSKEIHQREELEKGFSQD